MDCPKLSYSPGSSGFSFDGVEISHRHLANSLRNLLSFLGSCFLRFESSLYSMYLVTYHSLCVHEALGLWDPFDILKDVIYRLHSQESKKISSYRHTQILKLCAVSL